MSTVSLPTTTPIVVSLPSAALRLALLALLALLAIFVYYIVGIDEGMTSVFGRTTTVHEMVHDGRHFLGLPCH